MEAFAEQQVKNMTLEAVVIRADGTREDLGVIASYRKNWLSRAFDRLRGIGSITFE